MWFHGFVGSRVWSPRNTHWKCELVLGTWDAQHFGAEIGVVLWDLGLLEQMPSEVGDFQLEGL